MQTSSSNDNLAIANVQKTEAENRQKTKLPLLIANWAAKSRRISQIEMFFSTKQL